MYVHLDGGKKRKYVKTFIHSTHTLLSWGGRQKIPVSGWLVGEGGKGQATQEPTNHQRYRQGMSTTSSASDENWPGLCALSPQGQPCPRGAPSAPTPRADAVIWAGQCGTTASLPAKCSCSLPARWTGLGGTARPRGQSEGTESNGLLSEGAGPGSPAGGRPAGARAAGLGLRRCCGVWGAVCAVGGKRPSGRMKKKTAQNSPGFERKGTNREL